MQLFRRPAVALLIALLAAIVVFAAGYFLLVGPKKGEIDKKQKEVEGVENNKIGAEKATYKELLNIKNNSAAYEARLAHLQSIIPQEPELASLIRNLQAAADPGTGAGIPWLSFAPGEISAGETGSAYSSYTFTMRVGGFYDEVTDLIYRMERFSRAVVIDSISITSSTGFLQRTLSKNLGVVQADIKANAFTFAAPVGAAQQPASSTPTPSSQPQSSSPTSSTP